MSRKIFAFIAAAILVSSHFAVYAQDATPTITAVPTAAPTRAVPTPTADPSPTTLLPPTPTPTAGPPATINPDTIDPLTQPDETNVLPDTPVANGSAVIKNFPFVRNLSKKTYRGGENIRVVVVDETQPDKLDIKLIDAEGNILQPDIEKANNGNKTLIKIIPPPHFKPGKYTLRVTDSAGQTTDQDFSWGVLAINTNQSVYLPGQTAKLHMAVLDERGGDGLRCQSHA